MEGPMLLLDKKTERFVQTYIPNHKVIGELVDFFSVFSDSTRLKILAVLSLSEMCVTDLSNILEMNQTTVSHQLKYLRNMGCVRCRRQGKISFYSLYSEKINDVLLSGVDYIGY